MTFQEAVDICQDQRGGDFAKGMILTLVNLGLLKLDDMKPDDEYQTAIRAREIMDQLKPQSTDT